MPSAKKEDTTATVHNGVAYINVVNGMRVILSGSLSPEDIEPGTRVRREIVGPPENPNIRGGPKRNAPVTSVTVSTMTRRCVHGAVH